MRSDFTRNQRRWERVRQSARDAVEALSSLAALWRSSSNQENRAHPRNLGLSPRGLHRLVLNEDGSPRCTACQLCTVVCPSHCMEVKSTEFAPDVETSRPAVFTVDELKCVTCGLCVEACPIDALRMDGKAVIGPQLSPSGFLLDLTRDFRNPEIRDLSS